jgi:hypothetical protein
LLEVEENERKREKNGFEYGWEKALISWKIGAFFLEKNENNPCILARQLIY